MHHPDAEAGGLSSFSKTKIYQILLTSVCARARVLFTFIYQILLTSCKKIFTSYKFLLDVLLIGVLIFH